MARFAGRLGFAIGKETAPGVTTETIVERVYFGDLTRNKHSNNDSVGVNGEITLQNQVSIVADPYVFENYFAIRYVNWQGANWVVSSVDVDQYPRVTVTLGGVYNGPTIETP